MLVGSPRLLAERGVALEPIQAEIDRLQQAGKTAMPVAVDGRLAGVLAVADTIKPGSPAAIAALRELGLRVVMLTGDNQRAAEAIGREIGVERVLAEVLPADKAATIKQLQGEGKPRFEAIVEASKTRLRPILMTSFAFILGVLPLVRAHGAGAEMRFALGIAVFSGMLGVTLFGIFFTPVFYELIRGRTDRRAGRQQAPAAHVAPAAEPHAPRAGVS